MSQTRRIAATVIVLNCRIPFHDIFSDVFQVWWENEFTIADIAYRESSQRLVVRLRLQYVALASIIQDEVAPTALLT